jgi:hypothetical protein
MVGKRRTPSDCVPVAGKSSLNRHALGAKPPPPYLKIGHDPHAIAATSVDLFLDAHRPPQHRLFATSTLPMTRCMAINASHGSGPWGWRPTDAKCEQRAAMRLEAQVVCTTPPARSTSIIPSTR